MRDRLRLRYAHARTRKAGDRAFSVEIKWAGYPTVYEVVYARTDKGASLAAMYAGMRAAAATHRGKPDAVIVHADGGSKAQHINSILGRIK